MEWERETSHQPIKIWGCDRDRPRSDENARKIPWTYATDWRQDEDPSVVEWDKKLMSPELEGIADTYSLSLIHDTNTDIDNLSQNSPNQAFGGMEISKLLINDDDPKAACDAALTLVAMSRAFSFSSSQSASPRVPLLVATPVLSEGGWSTATECSLTPLSDTDYHLKEVHGLVAPEGRPATVGNSKATSPKLEQPSNPIGVMAPMGQDNGNRASNRKRRRANTIKEESEETAPIVKRVREKFVINRHNGHKEVDRYLHHIKEVLNARSKDVEESDRLLDAILPNNHPSIDLEEHKDPNVKKVKELNAKRGSSSTTSYFGEPGDLHSSEIYLCKQMDIKFDQYRIQKRRLFLGFAICNAYFILKRKHDDKLSRFRLGPSQAQIICNIDALKSAAMCRAFQKWGWVKRPHEDCEAATEDEDKSKAQTEAKGNGKGENKPKDKPKRNLDFTAAFLEWFPEDYRMGLLEEVVKWEKLAIEEEVIGLRIYSALYALEDKEGSGI